MSGRINGYDKGRMMEVWKPVVTAAAAILAGCGVFISYPIFRYRLGVEIDTPAGLRTGSSVIQISCSSVLNQKFVLACF